MQAQSSPPPNSFEVPYQRPESLSDPYQDFTPKLLAELLATSDDEFLWHHFQSVLGPFLPAGTYEESVYFLPRAFDYIVAHDDEALDLVTSIVWFVSEYAAELDKDGLLTNARQSLVNCFEYWVSEFRVEHYDREASAAKGWRIDHLDLVKNSEVLCQGTCDLVRFQRHKDIAESIAMAIADHRGDPVRAAWFLEYARARDDAYHPPHHGPIQGLLADRERLESAAAVVRSTVARSEPSPTYWLETFSVLGL